jgi:hypothetical protein
MNAFDLEPLRRGDRFPGLKAWAELSCPFGAKKVSRTFLNSASFDSVLLPGFSQDERAERQLLQTPTLQKFIARSADG